MSNHRPHLSIIIPARDEEYYLPLCLNAIERAQDQCRNIELEVVVVINRCTDRTEDIATARGCRIVRCDAKNLSKIRNAGVAQARGEIIITLDADSIISENMLREVLKCLADPYNIGGGVAMYPDRWSIGIACTMVPLIFMALRYGISGGMFFLRREDFIRLGGFDENLSSAEDVDFAKRLRGLAKASNRRFRTILRAYLITSCRKFDILGDWFVWRNPLMVYRLFGGKDQISANRIWYEIERKNPKR